MRGTTPNVAPNTKKNYNYKTLTLCVLQNPVTKCANTEAKSRYLECNEAVWKPTTEIFDYVKQRCLLLQVTGSATNISQLQKPKHQSECIQKLSEVF